ncbi:MAG: zinc-dependent peptidase [Puniceicoccaceae bacterium]
MASFLQNLKRLFQPKRKHVPFKPSWEDILEENLAIYNSLPRELKSKLRTRISDFIPNVYWEGVKGLELTEEMMVIVAAQACLLILNMEGSPYARLKTVILFPEVFVHSETSSEDGLIVSERKARVSGLSYDRGTVSLAWDEARNGASNKYDGFNVVIHEFAHQLDQDDGYANGAPILRRPQDYQQWNAVMQQEFETLSRDSSHGKATVLDDYGATNLAEFFAVATETFFEKARKLHKHHPELYSIMQQYYQLDPKNWAN